MQLFSESKLVAGYSNGNVALFDTSTGQHTRSYTSHNQAVNSIQTDGNTIVTSSNDSTIKEQVLETGATLHSYRDPQTPSPINFAQFDDKKIVSAQQDNTIKVWNRENGSRIYSLLGGLKKKKIIILHI